MKRTTIRLPDEMAQLLESEARRRNTSVSGLVRELVAKIRASSADTPRDIPWAGIFDDPRMVRAAHAEEHLSEQPDDDDDIDRDR